jgi:hypothetical protein
LTCFLLAACHNSTSGPPLAGGQHDLDGSVYESCETVCVRPSDCQIAYNDDGICPPGFRCAFRFQCTPDGG